MFPDPGVTAVTIASLNPLKDKYRPKNLRIDYARAPWFLWERLFWRENCQSKSVVAREVRVAPAKRGDPQFQEVTIEPGTNEGAVDSNGLDGMETDRRRNSITW